MDRNRLERVHVRASQKPVRSKPKPLETVKRTLHVGDRAMPLTIRENRRATRITLRIEPGGRALNLTVPAGLRSHEIDDFLDRHQGWLLTKLAKFSADNPIRSGGRIAFAVFPTASNIPARYAASPKRC